MPKTTAPQRRVAAVAGLVLAPLALSACSTSFSAQTNQTYQAGIGAESRGTGIDALALQVVDNGDDTGTLSATFVNKTEQDDQLTDVTTDVAGLSASLEDAVDLPVEQSVEVGADTADVVVTVDPDEVSRLSTVFAGRSIEMQLTFAVAPPITLSVPVVERSPMYDDVAPADPGATPSEASADDGTGEG